MLGLHHVWLRLQPAPNLLVWSFLVIYPHEILTSCAVSAPGRPDAQQADPLAEGHQIACKRQSRTNVSFYVLSAVVDYIRCARHARTSTCTSTTAHLTARPPRRRPIVQSSLCMLPSIAAQKMPPTSLYETSALTSARPQIPHLPSPTRPVKRRAGRRINAKKQETCR